MHMKCEHFIFLQNTEFLKKLGYVHENSIFTCLKIGIGEYVFPNSEPTPKIIDLKIMLDLKLYQV